MNRDAGFMRRALEEAEAAGGRGEIPVGAALVHDGRILAAAGNRNRELGDVTAHAETNLVRRAGRQVDAADLPASTLFTSCEPCAMCCGAIFWAGIGRVVYALSGTGLIDIAGAEDDGAVLDLPSREVFAHGGRSIAVSGPHLDEEAAAAHHGFWR